MNIKDAKSAILFHAGMDAPEQQSCQVFVGMFRPYDKLDERPFSEIIYAMLILHPALSRTTKIDRLTAFSLWGICDAARRLSLSPQSPVQHNNRIDAVSLRRVEWWTDSIEVMALRTLQGLDRPVCLSRFVQYIIDMTPAETSYYSYLQPFLQEAIDYDDSDIASEALRASQILGFENTQSGCEPHVP